MNIDAKAKKSEEGEALNKGRDLVSCSESEKRCFPVACNYRAVARLWFYTLSSNSFSHNCERAYFDVTHAGLYLIRQPIGKVVLHEILLLKVSSHDNCCIHRLRCKTGVFIVLLVLKSSVFAFQIVKVLCDSKNCSASLRDKSTNNEKGSRHWRPAENKWRVTYLSCKSKNKKITLRTLLPF